MPDNATAEDGLDVFADLNYIVGRPVITSNHPAGTSLDFAADVELPAEILDIAATGDLILAACGSAGLHIVEVLSEGGLKAIGRVQIEGGVSAVAPVGQHALVGQQSGGLGVVDLTRHRRARALLTLPLAGTVNRITVDNDRAYVAASEYGLYVVDIHDMSKPEVIGACPIGGYAGDVLVANGMVYVASYDAGLVILSQSALPRREEVATLQAARGACAVHVTSRHAFVAGTRGIYIVDVSTPSAPVHDTTIQGTFDAVGVAGENDRLLVAVPSVGAVLYDIAKPSRPLHLTDMRTKGDITAVRLENGVAYVCDRAGMLSCAFLK